MLAVAFGALGLDPSYAIGAELAEPGSNARHGTGDLFIAQADESDRSFHRYRPRIAIVLNIEEDHRDHYASLAEHLDSYDTLCVNPYAASSSVWAASLLFREPCRAGS